MLGICSLVEATEEKKLRVRYGLWLHDGVSTQAQSEAHWQCFTELPMADLHSTAKK